MPTATLKCRCCTDRGRREDMLRTPSGAVFINADHAAAYAHRNYRKNQHSIAKRAKGIEKAFQKRKREFKRDDAAHQRELTQKQCNKLASLLDMGLPCISCGRPHKPGKRRNASHLKSVGSNSFLRYCLININDSCVNCNLYKSGNIEGYKLGLVQRYGPRHLEYLETAPRLKEWGPEELAAMRKEFAAEIRHIQKGNPPSRDWRALPQAEEQAA